MRGDDWPRWHLRFTLLLDSGREEVVPGGVNVRAATPAGAVTRGMGGLRHAMKASTARYVREHVIKIEVRKV